MHCKKNHAITIHGFEAIKDIAHVEGNLHLLTFDLSGQGLGSAAHILCIGTDLNQPLGGISVTIPTTLLC